MAVAPESIITQVTPDNYDNVPQDLMYDQPLEDANTEIKLNIRGTLFTITRDELMALPESILLCLFPNGVFVDINGNVITNLTEEDVVYVNFPPECFEYIIKSFGDAAALLNPQDDQAYHDVSDADLLHEKPSIIVLREDLDYYCIPPINGISAEDMKELKIKTGDYLSRCTKIFDGLGYKPGKVLGPAEQHLLDMLCSSGYSVEDLWGHRSREPDKAIVSSLALVRLKHPESYEDTISSANTTQKSSPNLKPTVSGSQDRSRSRSRSRIASLTRGSSRSRSKKRDNSVANKLLLFWRKPARKCWWSNDEYEVELLDFKLTDPATGKQIKQDTKIRVHIRRVWTLELSVIGVQ